MTDPDRADGGDEQWQFGLDDVGDDGRTDASDQPRVRDPIEPESPSAENAFFVLVGAAATVALFATALLPA